MSAAFQIKAFDQNDRASFAQGMEIAFAQSRVELYTPGSLIEERRRNGRPFLYWHRYSPDGLLERDYLGLPGSREVKLAREQLNDLLLLRDTSKKLRRLGFVAVDHATVLTLASLFNGGVFEAGAVLVGTHAYGALLNALGVRVTPYPLTEDVDLAAYPKLAITPRRNLLSILEETRLPFSEVPPLNHKDPSTSLKVRGHKLKVDFLVPSRGEPYRPVRVAALDTYATGLPHLGYLLEAPLRSIVIGKDRLIPVRLPHPGHYCVHKLAVSSLRGSGSSKSGKDIFQAAALAAAISMTGEFEIDEAIKTTSASLKKAARAGAVKAVRLLGENHPEASEALSRLVK